MTDLVERIQAAAAEVIANERPGLERDADRLRGVVLDLKINSQGHIVDGTLYIERKVKPGQGGLR